ncbi:MAG: D-aminoacyl-tRNA deacylase [Spirochaetia bacterium]|nr:D-aminoacyl-tRNA deacylase [Spirochaetia bacterium]
MRAVIQRVHTCSVSVDEKIVGRIEKGLLVYLGVEKEDTEEDMRYLVDKTFGLRIFSDSDGKMNLSVMDINGQVLVVSQFTLCADTRKGKRPSYNSAASPHMGEQYYNLFVDTLRERGVKVETGVFGGKMSVTYTNDGPVTILLDSQKLF